MILFNNQQKNGDKTMSKKTKGSKMTQEQEVHQEQEVSQEAHTETNVEASQEAKKSFKAVINGIASARSLVQRDLLTVVGLSSSSLPLYEDGRLAIPGDFVEKYSEAVNLAGVPVTDEEKANLVEAINSITKVKTVNKTSIKKELSQDLTRILIAHSTGHLTNELIEVLVDKLNSLKQ